MTPIRSYWGAPILELHDSLYGSPRRLQAQQHHQRTQWWRQATAAAAGAGGGGGSGARIAAAAAARRAPSDVYLLVHTPVTFADADRVMRGGSRGSPPLAAAAGGGGGDSRTAAAVRCACDGGCGVVDDLRGMCGGAFPRRVRRVRVVVESVLGFHLAEELLGLRSSASSYDTVDGSYGGDDDSGGSDSGDSGGGGGSPVDRLARALLSLAGVAASGDGDGDGESDGGGGGGHVVVSWCEEGQTGWRAALLAPARADAAAHDDWEGGGSGGSGSGSGSSGSGALLVDLQLICAPAATMAPDLAWGARLGAWSAERARLVQANAVLSTLGGGRFLCRQVGAAMALARAQAAVAARMGDDTLRGKCAVNEAYGLIWLGRYARAAAAIAAAAADARARGDGELERFAATAAAYCARARAANRALRLRRAVPLGAPGGSGSSAVAAANGGSGSGGEGGGGGVELTVRDEYHRIRRLDRAAAAAQAAAVGAEVERPLACLQQALTVSP